MKFPQSMILHVLDEFNPTILNTHYLKNESFKGTLFLEGAGALEPGYLYICTVREFALLPQEGPALTFLCFGESESDFRCGPKNKSTLIFIPMYAMNGALNQLSLAFDRLRQWEQDLENLAWTDASIQQMVDASEALFTNPFLILDSSHKVIASSKRLPCGNEYFSSTLSNGFLSLRLLKSMTARGLMSEDKIYPEITTIAKPNMADCTLLIRTISAAHGQYGYLFQFCENAPPSDYEKFLLRTLIARIEQLLSRGKHSVTLKKYYTDYFIEELLDRTYADPELLAKRAKLVGLPLYGHYQLYEIVLGAGLHGEIAHVGETLKAMDFNYKIGIRENAIILLRHIRACSLTEDRESDDLNSIRYILKGYNAKIGVSDEFTELYGANDAHIQAQCAIELGMLLDGDRDTYFYEDYYIYHICAVCERSADLSTLACGQLRRLVAHDGRAGTDNTKLLEVFLNSDRNASVTARTMNLHRNSVLYRVKRIEEIMGVNLDQASVRIRLLLSLHILRYLERKKLQKELYLQEDY